MTQTRTHDVHRPSGRRIVQGVAVAAAIALALTGCATSATPASSASAAASFGTASIQLSWIKNTEFMGEFYADTNKYFTEAGFDSVNLIAGPASAEAGVISGTADLGIGNAISTGTVIANEGAPIKIIGATYQKNPFSILSLAKVGNIKTIADLTGKKIGVQASNQSLWDAFLKVNKIDPGSLTTVPVEYDPTPLFNGEVDGWFSYLTNEGIDADLKGLGPVNLPLADNGLPFVAETLTASDKQISGDRAKLKGLLIAEIKGWADSLKDPAAAAKLTIASYGADLGLTIEKETKQATIQATDLVVSPDTVKNGLFTISDKLQQESIDTLAAAGVTITADKLFDMSLLAEVYTEHPELVDYSK